MPSLLWGFPPVFLLLFLFYPAARQPICFNKAPFHHTVLLLRSLLIPNYLPHQVKAFLQTFMTLHNQISPCYTASFKILSNLEALHCTSGFLFTFPNYQTDSYFVASISGSHSFNSSMKIIFFSFYWCIAQVPRSILRSPVTTLNLISLSLHSCTEPGTIYKYST